MVEQYNPLVLFILEDDDDRVLLSLELDRSNSDVKVFFISDIDELIGFYKRQEFIEGQYQAPLASLILLDAFPSRSDIQQVVAVLKNMDCLSSVPRVVMLGTEDEIEYLQQYRLDVSGYVIKPGTIEQLEQFLAEPLYFVERLQHLVGS
jgi:CheY-like chemotaxis protein